MVSEMRRVAVDGDHHRPPTIECSMAVCIPIGIRPTFQCLIHMSVPDSCRCNSTYFVVRLAFMFWISPSNEEEPPAAATGLRCWVGDDGGFRGFRGFREATPFIVIALSRAFRAVLGSAPSNDDDDVDADAADDLRDAGFNGLAPPMDVIAVRKAGRDLGLWTACGQFMRGEQHIGRQRQTQETWERRGETLINR